MTMSCPTYPRDMARLDATRPTARSYHPNLTRSLMNTSTLRHGRALLLASILLLAACADADVEPSDSTVPTEPAAIEMGMPLTTDSEEARAAFMEGLRADDLGRDDEALAAYQRAVDSDPDFALAHLFLADKATSPEAGFAAISEAERAASGASPVEQRMMEMVRQDIDGNVEGALASAQALTEEAPESPYAWTMLAGMQADLKQHAEARQSMERAIEIAPSMVGPHLMLANSFMFATPKDFAQAETHIRHAIELAPNEARPHDLLGDLYRHQGRFEEARDAYTEAIAHAPEGDGQGYQQRGHVHSFLGDYDAARADFAQAMEAESSNAGAAFYHALVNVYAGEPDAAIEELKAYAARVDDMDMDNPLGAKSGVHNAAMRIAAFNDMDDEARELFTAWRALRNEHAEAVGTERFRTNVARQIANNEGRLAALTGDYAAATAQADELARLVEPDADPRKMETVHELKGLIAVEQGQYDAAIEHFRQADADDLDVKFYLAQALEGAGQTEEAMDLYSELADWNFNTLETALYRSIARDKVAMATS